MTIEKCGNAECKAHVADHKQAIRYDGPVEKCGNAECKMHVVNHKQAIRYDGYVFCTTRCRNVYSLGHDGETIGESGTRLFEIDRAHRNGPGGGNR